MADIRKIGIPVASSGTTGKFYGCLTMVTLDVPFVEICSGLTLEQTYVDVFGTTMAAFAPPEPPSEHHPAPWVAIAGGFSHSCRIQVSVTPDLLPTPMDGNDALWLAAAILRLQSRLPLRLAVAAYQPFTEMRISPKAAKPFAYESSPQQLGVFDTNWRELRSLSEEDIDWLQSFFPVAAKLLKDERFNRAFGIYDQALWSRTIETGMTLIWTALEALFEIGPHRDKTKAICRALSEYVTTDQSDRDRAYNIIQNLCVQRGRVVHVGHALDEQDAIQAYQLAKVVFRRVLIDQALPRPFTP